MCLIGLLGEVVFYYYILYRKAQSTKREKKNIRLASGRCLDLVSFMLWGGLLHDVLVVCLHSDHSRLF